MYVLRPELFGRFQSHFVNEMTKSPITPETWKSPAIFNYRAEPGTNAIDIMAMKYVARDWWGQQRLTFTANTL